MDEKVKIQDLWGYLKIQDDGVLIIQSYNHVKDSDEFIVVTKNGDDFNITTDNKLPKLELYQSFKFIQHLNADGKHEIPSVKQMKKDKSIDY